MPKWISHPLIPLRHNSLANIVCRTHSWGAATSRVAAPQLLSITVRRALGRAAATH